MPNPPEGVVQPDPSGSPQAHPASTGVAAVVAGAVVPLAAAAALVPLRTHTQASNLALGMVVVIALVVAPGRRLSAWVAGISAGVWFDFFLTRPYERFTIARSGDLQTTLLLVAVGVVVGEIAARRRRARAREETAQAEIRSAYVVAQMLSSGAPPAALVDTVAGELRQLLFLDGCRFERSAEAPHEPRLNRAGEVEYLRRVWDSATEGFPAKAVTLPVEHGGVRVGRFVLQGPPLGVPLTQDRRLAAVLLADLAGAALGANPALAG